jgi:hypothetical protein
MIHNIKIRGSSFSAYSVVESEGIQDEPPKKRLPSRTALSSACLVVPVMAWERVWAKTDGRV